MLTPLYIPGLIRADLMRARSMASALARNLGHVLDNADRALPFALGRLSDLIADDVHRLLGSLQGANDLHDRLGQRQITEMALSPEPAGEPLTASPPSAPIPPALTARVAA